jgi:hypothetical protein
MCVLAASPAMGAASYLARCAPGPLVGRIEGACPRRSSRVRLPYQAKFERERGTRAAELYLPSPYPAERKLPEGLDLG